MKDLKAQLKQWKAGHDLDGDPVEAPLEDQVSTQELDAQKSSVTIEDDATEEGISEGDKILFYEAVVHMNGEPAGEKSKETPQLQAAKEEVAALEEADRDIFVQEAMNFELDHARAQKKTDEKSLAAKSPLHKRVMRGAESPAVTCDLHGLSREDASTKVQMAITQCVQFNVQLLLVIHGKGQGLLRQQVVADLNAKPQVADHFAAPTHLGGEGARVVILKTKKGNT